MRWLVWATDLRLEVARDGDDGDGLGVLSAEGGGCGGQRGAGGEDIVDEEDALSLCLGECLEGVLEVPCAVLGVERGLGACEVCASQECPAGQLELQREMAGDLLRLVVAAPEASEPMKGDGRDDIWLEVVGAILSPGLGELLSEEDGELPLSAVLELMDGRPRQSGEGERGDGDLPVAGRMLQAVVALCEERVGGAAAGGAASLGQLRQGVVAVLAEAQSGEAQLIAAERTDVRREEVKQPFEHGVGSPCPFVLAWR